MTDRRQLVINMLAQIIAFAVSIIVGFFLTPFIVKRLGIEAYGFISLGNSFINYMLVFTLALNSMAVRFIAIKYYEGNSDEVNQYYSSLIVANAIVAGILTVIFLPILFNIDNIFSISQNMISDVMLLWGILFFDFLMNLFLNIFQIAINVRNRLDLANISKVCSCLINGIVLLFCYFAFTPKVWYVGIGAIIATMFALIYNKQCTRKLMSDIVITSHLFSIEKVKELVSSGIWNSINHMGIVLTNGLDALLANIFISTVAMGQVSISKTLPMYILMLFATISAVFTPKFMKDYANKDVESMKRMILLSIKFLSVLSIIPLAILFAYGQDFFKLWQPTQDSKVLQLLTIAGCLEFPFVLAIEPLWSVFTVFNKVKQSSIAVFVKGLIGIVTTLILLYTISCSEFQAMIIICGVTSVFNILMTFIFLIPSSAKLLKLSMSILYRVLVKNVLVLAIVIGVSIVIKNILIINTWVELIAASLITMLVSFLLSCGIVLDKDDRNRIVILLKSHIK